VEQPDELRQQFEQIAGGHLFAAAFDSNTPDPGVAWRAFKAFVREIAGHPGTVTIGYEALQAADRDRILWLTFMASIETESGVGRHVGYALSRAAPDALVGVDDKNWWWPERLTLDAWFEEVEANPVFRECLALDGWTWEGFSD
jgi:hypothetical protein